MIIKINLKEHLQQRPSNQTLHFLSSRCVSNSSLVANSAWPNCWSVVFITPSKFSMWIYLEGFVGGSYNTCLGTMAKVLLSPYPPYFGIHPYYIRLWDLYCIAPVLFLLDYGICGYSGKIIIPESAGTQVKSSFPNPRVLIREEIVFNFFRGIVFLNKGDKVNFTMLIPAQNCLGPC